MRWSFPPVHRGPRLILALWLTACGAALVFAFVQRNIDDTDIAFVYFMLFLTFPLGYLFAAAIGAILMLLNDLFGLSVLGGFTSNVVSWVLFVVVGHLQWFVLLPWLVRRIRRA